MKNPINTLNIIGIGILSFAVTTLACLLVIIFKPKEDELRLNEYISYLEKKKGTLKVSKKSIIDIYVLLNL